MPLEDFRSIDTSTIKNAILNYCSEPTNWEIVKLAFRIRAVENTLLSLFGQGRLQGTIHTCVGQELIGVIVGGYLGQDDLVTSNHRGHGHFIGVTQNWRGLIDEIVGNVEGVCGGIGGSQHLYNRRFMSNGQQGGLVPVAAGVALDRKRRASQGVAVSFIGEGTLGEGIVYETMNLASLWNLPLLIVCENNYYSQSTAQSKNLAGSICDRASAFGLKTYRASTWFPSDMSQIIDRAICELRQGRGPSFIQIETYRLNSHSKGDDNRDKSELSDFSTRDPLNILLQKPEISAFYSELLEETKEYAERAFFKPRLSLDEYTRTVISPSARVDRVANAAECHTEYFSKSLNRVYSDLMRDHEEYVLVGEDIADPYGGAFKITDGIDSKYAGRVISTPISEAAIVGVGIGLAITGNRPIVEIMFGDFMTFTVDQIINNAAKLFHMYNRKLHCPIVIRAPMGGRRGYGPTHSQSLEKHFVGIGQTIVLSLNALVGPDIQLASLPLVSQPIIIFENKLDYARKRFICPRSYLLKTDESLFPTIVLTPQHAKPTLTIFSYGGMARFIAENLIEIFDRTEYIVDLVVPTAIFPLEIRGVLASVENTKRIVTIEEGALFANVGAEIVAQVTQQCLFRVASMMIGAIPVPIPSEPNLESLVLPSLDLICTKLNEFKCGGWS